jgi:hypothetical protein
MLPTFFPPEGRRAINSVVIGRNFLLLLADRFLPNRTTWRLNNGRVVVGK